MKQSEFKKLIKESVREAIKEELKDILLEAIKAPRETKIVKEEKIIKENKEEFDPIKARSVYKNILNDMAQGKDELNFNTNNLIPRGPIDTISEGSSLPNFDVPLDFIQNLTKNK